MQLGQTPGEGGQGAKEADGPRALVGQHPQSFCLGKTEVWPGHFFGENDKLTSLKSLCQKELRSA